LEEGNVLFDSLGIVYFETLKSIFGLADVGVGGTVNVLTIALYQAIPSLSMRAWLIK
jgi:hypothetical protein